MSNQKLRRLQQDRAMPMITPALQRIISDGIDQTGKLMLAIINAELDSHDTVMQLLTCIALGHNVFGFGEYRDALRKKIALMEKALDSLPSNLGKFPSERRERILKVMQLMDANDVVELQKIAIEQNPIASRIRAIEEQEVKLILSANGRIGAIEVEVTTHE